MKIPRIRMDGLTYRTTKWVGFVAIVGFAVAVPFLYVPFVVQQLSLVLVYAIAIAGLNLLVGFSGQVSLAHSAFFAVGAYTGAALVTTGGWSYLAPLPVAAAICFVLGLLIGIPALRLRGLYLAMVTFGLALAVPPLITRLEAITGGNQGIVVTKPELPAWLNLAADQWVYFIVLAVAAIGYVTLRNLVAGRLGRGLIVMRDKELVALSLGVNPAKMKSLAFAWSALFAGVAGCLFSYVTGYVAPGSFTFMLAITLLAAAVIGGINSIVGALLGGFFIQYVPQFANSINQGLVGVIYAVILIAVLLLAPQGLIGLIKRAVMIFVSQSPGGKPDELSAPTSDLADETVK